MKLPLLLLVVGIATYGVYNSAAKMTKMVPVLVASRDLPKWSVIGANDIGWEQEPYGAVQQGSIQDPRQLLGKAVNVSIHQGEEVMAWRVALDPFALKGDEVAVSVATDLTRAVGGIIRPGDRVALVYVPKNAGTTVTVSTPGGKGQQATQTVTVPDPARIVLDGIRVLSLENQDGAVTSAQAQSGGAGSPPIYQVPAVAVLKMTQDQAVEVAQDESSGTLVLALEPGSN